MEKQRRRDVRGIVGKIAAVVFAAGFVLSIVPAIRALAEGVIFKIQSAEITEISDGATGNISTYDEQNIVSNVTFHKINDSVSYKIVLKNSDAKDYMIESITDDNTSEQISYAYDAHAGETIAAGADLDFLLTAKYTTPVTDMTKRAMASNVKFFIKFAEKEEPEEIDIVVPNTDAETPVVPDTGANTKDSKGAGISLATMIISAVGLTVLALIAVKKHKKYAKIIGVAVVAVSAFGLVTSARAANIETNSFTLTTNYGFYDKLVIKNGDKDVVIDYGEKLEDVDEITEPTKPGYIFDGWEDENGNPVDPTKPITEDITIKPKFVANTYTVKFDANGGNGTMADMQFTYDEAQVLTQNAFNFMGREYTGWDTKPNGSGVHYADKAEVKNLTTENNGVVTLYAQWSINPFHIDYDGNGATSGEMAITNCEYDEACELRDNAFEKYGYDFAGWKYNDTIYADKADVTNIIDHGTITMVAQWTPHVYTITYTGLTNEEAAALRAQGNPDDYTIETTSFTLIKPADRKDADGDVREHCIGWRDVTVYEDVTLPISNALGNKTYEAVWQTVALEEFDITYDYDGGNVATANPTKLTKEQSATLNEPTKTGYTFTGWTGTTISGDTPVKPYTIPAPHQKGNLEYTAHYRANTYTVNFDINTDDTHVSGTMQPLVLNYDEEKALTANTFTRTGYTFAGWKLGDTEYTDGQTVKNLTAEDGATVTLYAKWNPIHYTIKFDKNDNAAQGNINPIVVTYDENAALPSEGFIKEHYKFMGWATTGGGAVAYEPGANIINLTAEQNKEITLYAVWRERTAVLNTGSNVNAALLSVNANTTAFEHYSGTPNLNQIDGEQDIALTTSNFPVYVWTADNKTYWWSEAEDVYMNQNSSSMFASLNSAESIDLRSLDTSNVQKMGSMFQEDYALTSINVSEIDTRNVTSMAGMFIRCTSLATLDFSKFDTSKVENMQSMFKETAFTELDLSGWNTSSLTNAITVFSAMPNLEKLDLSGWDFSKLNHAFSRVIAEHSQPGKYPAATVSKPKTIILDDAIFPTDMSNAFINNSYGIMSRLEGISLDNVDTTRTTTMEGMFEANANITELDLTDVDFGNVENTRRMFYKTSNLETIVFANDIDTSNVTDMGGMFNEATSLRSVDVSHFNTAKVENMSGMFRYTPNLTNVDVSNFSTDSLKGSLESLFSYNGAAVLDLSGWDTSGVTIMRNLFLRNTAVTTIYASDSFVVSQVATEGTDDDGVFQHMSANLVGGAGTIFSGLTPTNLTYARIDDPDNGESGFFAIKGARYIRYNGNGADNATPYGAMKSEYLKTGDKLTKNAFVRDGYVFTGWKDADNNDYSDEQIMTGLTESKTPLTLYAQWEAEPDVDLTFYNITSMQQMTADICATATTPNTNASQFDTTGENVGNKSYIPRRELIDNRDGKSYQVTKLADGKCWMTENLAIGDTDSTMTLTPDDSDVSSDFTLPKSDITAFAGNSDVSAVYVDDTYGGYYSVKTANVDFAEYGKSICPKGWKLPIAYNSGDWSALKRKYNIEEGTSSNNALYDEPFNYTRSFHVSNRRIAVNDWLDTAYIGPATGNGSFSNFGVTISENYSGTAGITGAEGGSIRCVAR